MPAPVFTLDNPEHINARDGATGGDINRMYGSVCLGEPGIDFSSEAEFTKEFGCPMLVLLPLFHQPALRLSSVEAHTLPSVWDRRSR